MAVSTEVRKIAACAADALEEGCLLKVDPPGHSALALCRIEGRIHAFDDTCTHGEASLSDGELFGEDVVCPFHSGTFCVLTGAATGYPAEQPVRVYRTSEENGTVFVELPVAAT